MNPSDIRRAVAECRAKYPVLDAGAIPIDMVRFWEIDLRLSLIPVPGLFKRHAVDAAILPGGDGIYVDENSYVALDTNPPRLSRRLRFTLAHEFAHLVLHMDAPSALRWSSVGHFEMSVCSIDRTIEREADEFPGQLLVPYSALPSAFKARNVPPHILANPAARHCFAAQLSPRFGVNPHVIGIWLDLEGIWPAI